MQTALKSVDRVEILTLQDNYIDLTSGDSTPMVQRAMPIQGNAIRQSVLAEHGFATLVSVTSADAVHRLMFDFGFSANGAALNADALGVDLGQVGAMALSHGHFDHFGGLAAVAERVGRRDIPLVLHPEGFRAPRYMQVTEQFKLFFPTLDREDVTAAGVAPVESAGPYALFDGAVVFLGEIPRETPFEQGAPNLFYDDAEGEPHRDTFEDDTAVVAHLAGKGLVVLSGCAHSGIVNTVRHARAVTGVDRVHAVMGGFHLSGPGKDELIRQTVAAMQEIDPDYLIPTHCTGRRAIAAFEAAMGDKVIVNMAGTRLVFA